MSYVRGSSRYGLRKPRFDEMKAELRPRLERITNQHDLMVAALRQAGGVDADQVVRGPGKVADVLFLKERLIVEVKSLTSNRAAMPRVQEKLGSILMEHSQTIAFGHVSIDIDRLEPHVAGRMLREIGDRLRKEVRAAAKQLEATASSLGWDDFEGVVAIVAPPEVMRRDIIRWIVNDVLGADNYPVIRGAILASTPYLTSAPMGDSHLSFHLREGSRFPERLSRKISSAWARLQGQPLKQTDFDPLLGAAEC